MPTYRLYRLDGAGKISAAEWIDAADDEEAHLKAREHPDAHSYELWERKRLVARVDADGGPSASLNSPA